MFKTILVHYVDASERIVRNQIFCVHKQEDIAKAIRRKKHEGYIKKMIVTNIDHTILAVLKRVDYEKTVYAVDYFVNDHHIFHRKRQNIEAVIDTLSRLYHEYT